MIGTEAAQGRLTAAEVTRITEGTVRPGATLC